MIDIIIGWLYNVKYMSKIGKVLTKQSRHFNNNILSIHWFDDSLYIVLYPDM